MKHAARGLRLSSCMIPMLLASVAGAQMDDFSSGVNTGGWAFGGPSEFISPTGGNPGGYLRSAGLDTTIPWLRCAEGSPFTGDFRERGVTAATIDVNVFSTDFNIGAFPLSVIIHSDNGTAANFDDDWAVYKLGAGIPAPGSGWKHVSIAIPSQSSTLPAGWEFMQFGPGSPPSADWNMVITHVTRLEFSFGDPSLFYIFQMWTIGVDNIGLTTAPVCYANCDASTAVPVLNANDFNCFLNKFAAADPSANCDQSTNTPVLNANDFNCFLNKFAAGCN